MHVKNICLSLFGTIQPSKLLGYLQAASGYENDGFVQRLQLAVFPDRPTWEYTDEVPEKAARDRAYKLIRQIAETDLGILGFQADEYNRFPYIRFSSDAQEVFKQWLIHLETTVLRSEAGLLLEHFAKYRSLMPSLALVFHVTDCVDAGITSTQPISKSAAQMAIRWCDYLMSHARRIYGLLDTVSIEGAERILKEIKRGRLPSGFKVRDVVRKSWSQLKTTEQVEAAVSELVDRHYLREVMPEELATGRPESPTYLIHPNLFSNA
jgi:hypothetical protein